MDHLMALTATADMIGSVTTGDFQVAVTVDANSPLVAAQIVSVIVRTAGHAAGAETHSWPAVEEETWPDWFAL
jgi:hypothetical protein